MSPGNLLEVQSLGPYPRTMEPGILSWGWSALTRSPGDADARSSLRTSGLNLYHQSLPTYGVSVLLSHVLVHHALIMHLHSKGHWSSGGPWTSNKMAGNMVNQLPLKTLKGCSWST